MTPAIPPDTPYRACMQEVARVNRLPIRLLPALYRVEGGSIGMANRNRNGTEDLGVMQINTVWVQPLVRFTGWPAARIRALLINDPCFNIAVAGAVLSTYRAQAHGDLLRAIGDYHSHTLVLNQAYLERVLRAAERLVKAQHDVPPALAPRESPRRP